MTLKLSQQLFIDYIDMYHKRKGDCRLIVACKDKNLEIEIKKIDSINIRGKTYSTVIVDEGID